MADIDESTDTDVKTFKVYEQYQHAVQEHYRVNGKDCPANRSDLLLSSYRSDTWVMEQCWPDQEVDFVTVMGYAHKGDARNEKREIQKSGTFLRMLHDIYVKFSKIVSKQKLSKYYQEAMHQKSTAKEMQKIIRNGYKKMTRTEDIQKLEQDVLRVGYLN